MFDLTVIQSVYRRYETLISQLRRLAKRPLTLTEKILYTHLSEPLPNQLYKRGDSYVNFDPDRVAMQDATAQMALLQFMQAGKTQTAVPTTVHCDHLIQAEVGADADLSRANQENKEVYDFRKGMLDPELIELIEQFPDECAN